VRPSETTLATQVANNQMIKIIVLLIVIITIYSCGIKPKIGCNVNSIDNAITECKESPEFGISKSF
jgi:hypothetical protein